MNINLLNGTTISGGSLDGRNGGQIYLGGGVGNSATLSNLTNLGVFRVYEGNSASLSGTSFVNNGTVTVNPNATSTTTTLNISSNVTLSGTGQLVLNAYAPAGGNYWVNGDTARIVATNGATLTQAAGHSITGIGNICAPVDNAGLIQANAADKILCLQGATTNSGTLSSINGSWLCVAGGSATLNQIPGGKVLADGGWVDFFGNSVITGGILDSRNGGQVVIGQQDNATLCNVTNLGSMRKDWGGTAYITGTSFVNNGTFTVNPLASNNTTTLNINSNVILSGSGRVVLNANSSDMDSARIIGSNGATLTQAAGHTITGAGKISCSLNNEGSILSDGQAGQIHIQGTTMNSGTIGATNGGWIHVNNGASLTQTPGGTILADGGVVDIYASSVITGGILDSRNGGQVFVGFNSSATLSNVTNLGSLSKYDLGTAYITGTSFVNNGTFTVNTLGYNNTTSLNISSNVILSGTGRVVLNANSSDMDSARIIGSNGATLTQAAGHTITGAGKISCSLNNEGSILSDGQAGQIHIQGTTMNSGTIGATNGGWIHVNNGASLTQTSGGTILADGGVVDIYASSVITGGILDSRNGGQVFVGYNSDATLSNVTNLGSLSKYDLGTAFITGTSFVNNGTFTVNTLGYNNTTTVSIDSNVLLSGTGRIVLNAYGSNWDTARLTAFNGTTITQGAGHTITGQGNISANLLNGGILDPGFDTGYLQVSGALSLLDSSDLKFEIGGLAQALTYDFLNVTGTVLLDGLLDLSFTNGFESLINDTEVFTLMSAASPIAGVFDNAANGGRVVTADGRYSFQVNYGPGSSFSANSVVISDVETVPEPSTLILTGLGLLYLAMRRQKRGE